MLAGELLEVLVEWSATRVSDGIEWGVGLGDNVVSLMVVEQSDRLGVDVRVEDDLVDGGS